MGGWGWLELEVQVYRVARVQQSADQIHDVVFAAQAFVAWVAKLEVQAKRGSDQQVLRIELGAFLPQVGGGDGLYLERVVGDRGGGRWHGGPFLMDTPLQ